MSSYPSNFIEKMEYFRDIIPDYSKFQEAYSQFSSFLGNEEVKKNVERKIISWMYSKKQNKNETTMKHIVLKGGPGCGKTTFAKNYGKLICSLGLLKPAKSVVDKMKTLIKNNIDLSQSFLSLKRKIHNVYDDIKDLQRNISRSESFRMQRLRNVKYELKDMIDTQLPSFTEVMKEETSPFIIATRKDLIGEYIGQTAPKTQSVIDKALGGVLFIDEAYNLCNNTERNDGFDTECLTCLNVAMSEYPENLIVIFAGYSDQLENGIFKIQRGLERRISLNMHLEEYSEDNLYNIFKKQVQELTGWEIDEDCRKLFKKEDFPFFGGDTEMFSGILKDYCCERFIFNTKNFCSKIIPNDYIKAIFDFRKLRSHKKTSYPEHMFM